MFNRVVVSTCSVIAIALVAWAIAVVPATRTSSSMALRATGSEVLSGIQEYASVEIPRGVTVQVEGDLVLRSTGAMVIEGELVTQSVSGTFHGASIRLEAAERVVISGSIRAGDGVAANPDRPGEDGGNGGSIVVAAPLIQGGGALRAGNGGWGGRMGRGGNGGTVELLGLTDSAGGSVLAIFGGDGGRGGDGVPGLTAGDGGDGGNAYAAGPINGANGPPGSDVTGACGSNGKNGTLCADGTSGGAGVAATGGNGGNGGDGIDGGNGGSGGRGGNATGGCGGSGGHGGTTCTSAWTGGGDGGNGGSATGGRGGNGGNGGSACLVGGPGGAGGAGGNGGSATGGNGGDGGNRNGSCPFSCPPKNAGDGGDGGLAISGSAGDGGRGGEPLGVGGAGGVSGVAVGGVGGRAGTPNGSVGADGHWFAGSNGANGQSSGICADGCNNAYTFTGEAANDQLGHSVSGAGDVNNDGYADVVVGAPLYGVGVGRVYVHSGLNGTLLRTLTGQAQYDQFGCSVSGAGDINFDGYADIVVGAPWAAEDGQAYVYSGWTGALLRSFHGEAYGDGLGSSVADAGDVNNDGYPDVLVGAPYNDAGGDNAGRAYVYSGQTGSLLLTFTGETAGDNLGLSLSGAGDVNNDGFDDVLVGARLNDVGGDNAGRAYVYSGQSGSLLWTFTGEYQDLLGFCVSGAGDVNKDGYADIVVGAPNSDSPTSTVVRPGLAYVYSGKTGGQIWTFTGSVAFAFFGCTVSGAGDVNKDGYADVVVGAVSLADVSVYVYSGQTGALLRTLISGTANDYFGFSISDAGDVNNDGHGDLVVGAPEDDAQKVTTNKSGVVAVGAQGNHAVSVGPGRAYVFVCPCDCPHQGDLSEDGVIDVFDVINLIGIAFSGGVDTQDPGCPKTRGDVNNDNDTNVFDVIYLIETAFSGGAEPVNPCVP